MSKKFIASGLCLTLIILGGFLGFNRERSVDNKVDAIPIHTHIIERIDMVRFGYKQGDIPRVNLPFFDAEYNLQWNDQFVHVQTTGACDTQPPTLNANGRPVYPRRVLLTKPRVDLRTCQDGKQSVIGFNEEGKVVWTRELGYRSGSHTIRQWIISGAPSGLVTNDLEVWSPTTGETIFPALSKPIPRENREVPRYSFVYSALFRPNQKDFLIFDPDGSYFSRGGVYRFQPVSGDQEYLFPTERLKAGYIHIDTMRLDLSGRYLLIGQHWAVRGPGWASFAVFDLEAKKKIFEDFLDKDSLVSELYLTIGENNEVAFSYRNETKAEYVLVHYRVQP